MAVRVDNSLIVRCDTLPEYQAALAKLLLWNSNSNVPSITLNAFLNQLRINVTFQQQEIQLPEI